MVTLVVMPNHIACWDKYTSWTVRLEHLLLVAFLLGILNAFVRPVLKLIAWPLVFLTLGLFMFVINALVLSLLTLLLPFFHITSDGVHFSFLYAFLGALLISFISTILNVLTGNSRISVKTQPPHAPPGGGGGNDGGNGPVIDV